MPWFGLGATGEPLLLRIRFLATPSASYDRSYVATATGDGEERVSLKIQRVCFALSASTGENVNRITHAHAYEPSVLK